MSHIIKYGATLDGSINISPGERANTVPADLGQVEEQKETTPLLPGQSTPQRASKLASHLRGSLLKYIFGFVVVVILIITLLRTAMLGAVTWLPCSNMTWTNSSDYTEIPDVRYYEVTDLLYVLYSFLDCPEYLVLTYNVYKLCVKKSSEGKTSITIKEDFLKNTNIYVWCGITLAIVFIIIFTLAAVAITVVGVLLFVAFIDTECYPEYKEQEMVHAFHLVYQILTFIDHVVSLAIRFAMILTVLRVRVIWFHTDTDKTTPDRTDDGTDDRIDDRTDDIADSTLLEVEKRVVSRYYESVKKYEQRVDKIKPLLQVFQTWFVFQWFQYFFQAVTNLTGTIHPWLTGIYQPKVITAYYGVFTLYDILAFSIPHVCGLKINAYHEQYLRDERNNLLEKTETQLEYVKAYSMKIEKSKYGDFVPGIRMTGIKVPLDSTGYTLGIFLTIFTLAGSFIKFNA